MYRKSPRNQPFFTDRFSACPENPAVFPRNRAFFPANLTLKIPRNLPFFPWSVRSLSWMVPFLGVGGGGLVSVTITNRSQCVMLAKNGPTRFALKHITQWTTEWPTIFTTQLDNWKLVSAVFFVRESSTVLTLNLMCHSFIFITTGSPGWSVDRGCGW